MSLMGGWSSVRSESGTVATWLAWCAILPFGASRASQARRASRPRPGPHIGAGADPGANSRLRPAPSRAQRQGASGWPAWGTRDGPRPRPGLAFFVLFFVLATCVHRTGKLKGPRGAPCVSLMGDGRVRSVQERWRRGWHGAPFCHLAGLAHLASIFGWGSYLSASSSCPGSRRH